MGGFDEEAVFEDVDFFKRLKQRGRVVILKEAVQTSSRRFQKVGFAKQKAINLGLSLLSAVGVSPKPLMKHFYPDVR